MALRIFRTVSGSVSGPWRNRQLRPMTAARWRRRKRDFRRLWIARINAAARLNGVSYSRLIGGLKQADVRINRKMLAQLAVADPSSFATVVNATQG